MNMHHHHHGGKSSLPHSDRPSHVENGGVTRKATRGLEVERQIRVGVDRRGTRTAPIDYGLDGQERRGERKEMEDSNLHANAMTVPRAMPPRRHGVFELSTFSEPLSHVARIQKHSNTSVFL